MLYELNPASSLEKFFPDRDYSPEPCPAGIGWRGEVFSWQAVGRGDGVGDLPVRVDPGRFPGTLEWFEVISVPCDFPCFRGDAHFVRTTPGLFPDLLQPRREGFVRWPPNQWRSIWLRVRIPTDCPPGCYPLELIVGNLTCRFELSVADDEGAPFTLQHTEWFHADCLASVYRVPTWSEDHWRIVENFVRDAVDHHINTLYTPLWTPPLDTAVQGERPTTQLLQIRRDECDKWNFDFSRLERWCAMAERCGVERLELAHFFTQWGAAATPKIVAECGGKELRVFGWNVPAESPEYRAFLAVLLPQLHQFFAVTGWEDRIICHISDEPNPGTAAAYAAARDSVAPFLGTWQWVEALSEPELYDQGLVDHPVPSIARLDRFRGVVPELWCYYCCLPEEAVPNRFFALPSARIRILGVLAYVYDLKGFLHWGFNFYYSQFSRKVLNPFLNTDGDRAFPGGDPFLVYPGENGIPWSSLRHELLREAWQDWQVLKRHELRHGREATLRILHQGLDRELSVTEYPHDPAWLLALRSRLTSSRTGSL